MNNHCEKIDNYATFYEWFLEMAMSEVVSIDTRRISGCCVCELPLWSVCVGCDWVLSGFNQKRVVIVYAFCFCHFYVSLWACVNCYCKRKNDSENRRIKMDLDLTDELCQFLLLLWF